MFKETSFSPEQIIEQALTIIEHWSEYAEGAFFTEILDLGGIQLELDRAPDTELTIQAGGDVVLLAIETFDSNSFEILIYQPEADWLDSLFSAYQACL